MRVALPFGRTPEGKRGAYRKALEAVGIQAAEDAATLAGLDGLLLAGGTDVDPSLYGAAPHPETGRPDLDRDTLEGRLVREALEGDLPILAICRGQQMLNIVLGGTLHQHIEGHRSEERDAHRVAIAAGSRLHTILGQNELTVNSRHHQAVDRVGEGLLVTAAAGTVIEAVEMPEKRFVVAVQWHPEDRTDGTDAKLFTAFADALK
jgi:putative glutamine amidotransferase